MPSVLFEHTAIDSYIILYQNNFSEPYGTHSIITQLCRDGYSSGTLNGNGTVENSGVTRLGKLSPSYTETALEGGGLRVF